MTLPPVYHLLFALGVIWGASWVLADSKISRPFRLAILRWRGEQSWLLQLLECPACTSFWMGVAMGRWEMRVSLFASLCFGFLACGFSLFMASITIGIDYKE